VRRCKPIAGQQFRAVEIFFRAWLRVTARPGPHGSRRDLLKGALGLALTAPGPVFATEGRWRARIRRDRFGVPHIHGATDADAVFGFAYAQAEDNFAHLEDNFIRALGRGAEIHGASAFADDRLARALEIPRLARAEYARAGPAIRAIYDAFAEGLNHFVESHPSVRPALLARFEPWFPLALLRFKYHQLEFVGYAGLVDGQLRFEPSRHGTEQPHGSNAWAVGPSKSATGRALLLINPHVGFYGVGQYYEAHLTSDTGWNFSGVGRYGFPFPYMGHNDALGWGHTDNYPDIGDLYAETFPDPARPLHYRYGDGLRQAAVWDEEIRVRTPAGLERRVQTFRKTHHGPIVAAHENRPVALRLAGLEEGGWFEQWHAMTRARSLREFKRALQSVAIPYMNITYADRDGNIFYAYNGRVPRRSTRFDWRRPVDGSDPATEWQGYHAFSELPQVENPTAGYVQNCNSTPFATSASANPDRNAFPAYMIGPERDNARAQVSRHILESQSRFSFDQWTRLATDSRVWEARHHVPGLVADWNGVGSAGPLAALAPLIAELEAWDQIADTNSVATTLFVRYFMRRANIEAAATDPAVRLGLLDEVRRDLEASWGDWRVPWGEINRLQRTAWDGSEAFSDDRPSLPVRGAPGPVGIIFNFYTAPPPAGSRRHYGRLGNSYVSVVSFGARTEARSIVYYGQSGDPASPHYFDQAPLYARGLFKPAWFDEDDVRANTERAYLVGS
jgi:acyl-homoserine lactone acylase PvdQ